MLIVGGAKFHSLLSAHHLVGAYFLTTKSDKCMHLLTFYGTCIMLALFCHVCSASWLNGFVMCEGSQCKLTHAIKLSWIPKWFKGLVKMGYYWSFIMYTVPTVCGLNFPVAMGCKCCEVLHNSCWYTQFHMSKKVCKWCIFSYAINWPGQITEVFTSVLHLVIHAEHRTRIQHTCAMINSLLNF